MLQLPQQVVDCRVLLTLGHLLCPICESIALWLTTEEGRLIRLLREARSRCSSRDGLYGYTVRC